MKFIFAAFVFSLWGFVFADDHIFADGSDWEVVSSGHQFAEGMAWDEDGHFYFTDVPRLQLFKVDKDSGIKTLVDAQSGRTNGIAFGPDGKLYGCSSKDEGINVWNPNTWEKETLAKGTPSNDIAILDDGTIFFTDPNNKSVWRIDANSRERTLAASLAWKPNGKWSCQSNEDNDEFKSGVPMLSGEIVYIEHLRADVAKKTLGVYVCPTGSTLTHFKNTL